MKDSYLVVGIILIVVGGIWFLQGVNVLPGSFMTGDRKWAVIGGACVLIGLGMIVVPRLLKR